MSDSSRYQSDPCRDLPVTTTTHNRVRMVYALSRSYRNRMAAQPAQNQVSWRYNQKKAVFALCDGRESPLDGRLAARFLGERLVDWLWALPDDSQIPQDELKVRLAYQLNAWAQLAQEQVLDLPFPAELSPPELEQLESVRRAQGSETMFLCARMDFNLETGPQVLFAWAGDAFLRCYTAQGEQVQFDPVRSPANRWSSVLGLRGSLSVARLDADYDIWRILACSPELGAVEPDLSNYSPRRLQSLLQECFLSRSAGDLALVDVWFREPQPESTEEPIVVSDFHEDLGQVRLHYLETSDHTGVFEWSFPPDAVYSIIEEQTADGRVQPVYAGAGGHWIVPPDRQDCKYRVCVFSPDGQSTSAWLDPVLVEGHEWQEESGAASPLESVTRESQALELLLLSTETESMQSHPMTPDPDEEPPSALDEIPEPSAPVAEALSLDDLGAPLWPDTAPEAAPPEKETSAAAPGLDWDTWQPSYYGSSTTPTSPVEPVSPEPKPAPVELFDLPTTEPAPVETGPLEHPDLPPEEPLVPVDILPAVETLDLAPLQITEQLPVMEPALPQPSEPEPEAIPHAGWLNFRASRGDQPGEYVLEWEPVTQVRDFEIKKHFAGRDRTHTVRGPRDTVKGLEPGRHYFRIRPIYPGPRQEWDEHNLAVIEVPERIQQPPTNLRLETNPDGAFTLTWTFPPGSYVEEFWVYDALPRTAVLLHRLQPDASRCVLPPPAPDTRCKYTVRAVNWSGVGPESQPVVYDPPGGLPQPPGWERVLRFLRPSPAAPAAVPIPSPSVEARPEKEEIITCTTFYELCDQVTRYLKRHGIRMERIRLEQRVGAEDNYIPVDSRRTTELVSLNFTKGPDHRLFVFGSKGELVTAMITFDKRRWTMAVRFTISKVNS